MPVTLAMMKTILCVSVSPSTQDKLGELQALVMQLLGERNMLHSYHEEASSSSPSRQHLANGHGHTHAAPLDQALQATRSAVQQTLSNGPVDNYSGESVRSGRSARCTVSFSFFQATLGGGGNPHKGWKQRWKYPQKGNVNTSIVGFFLKQCLHMQKSHQKWWTQRYSWERRKRRRDESANDLIFIWFFLVKRHLFSYFPITWRQHLLEAVQQSHLFNKNGMKK